GAELEHPAPPEPVVEPEAARLARAVDDHVRDTHAEARQRVAPLVEVEAAVRRDCHLERHQREEGRNRVENQVRHVALRSARRSGGASCFPMPANWGCPTGRSGDMACPCACHGSSPPCWPPSPPRAPFRRSARSSAGNARSTTTHGSMVTTATGAATGPRAWR